MESARTHRTFIVFLLFSNSATTRDIVWNVGLMRVCLFCATGQSSQDRRARTRASSSSTCRRLIQSGVNKPVYDLEDVAISKVKIQIGGHCRRVTLDCEMMRG